MVEVEVENLVKEDEVDPMGGTRDTLLFYILAQN